MPLASCHDGLLDMACDSKAAPDMPKQLRGTREADRRIGDLGATAYAGLPCDPGCTAS